MASIYILQKLLSILILLRLKFVYSFLCIILFFVIFFLKDDSFDIGGYTTLASTPGIFELFYSGIIDTLQLFVTDNRTVIYIYQLLLVCLASSMAFFFKENKFLILAVLISSVAMMLGVHNNLRQGTASIWMLLGIISFIQGKKKIGVLSLLISLGFHSSSYLFVVLISTLGIVYKSFVHKYPFKGHIRIFHSYGICIILTLIFITILSNIINLPIAQSGRINWNTYVGMDLVANDPGRVNHQLKILILFLFWLSTEFLLRSRSIDFQLDFIRYLRQFFLIFVVGLSFFPLFNEVGNRILYLYYVMEMGLLCFLIDRKLFKITVFILLSYTFAFNVWTILGGI